MAATSTMLPLGSQAPDFALPDPEGRVHALADFSAAPALVVVFMANHCPYARHVRAHLAEVGAALQARGVAVVAVASNDAGAYPQDGPEGMAEEAREAGYPFPYVFDETQEVAKAYRAACTPDFYVFDGEHRLAYRGQFDASRPGNDLPVTGDDLVAAVDAVLGGGRPDPDQTPSVGCSIKWRPGNEPEYA